MTHTPLLIQPDPTGEAAILRRRMQRVCREWRENPTVVASCLAAVTFGSWTGCRRWWTFGSRVTKGVKRLLKRRVLARPAQAVPLPGPGLVPARRRVNRVGAGRQVQP